MGTAPGPVGGRRRHRPAAPRPIRHPRQLLPRGPGPVQAPPRLGGPLCAGDIVAVASTFEHLYLAYPAHESRAGAIYAQLRWLKAAGYATSRRRRKARKLTEPFQYVDTWGWKWLRRALVQSFGMSRREFTAKELLRNILATAASGSPSNFWKPAPVTFKNLAFIRAYQTTQQLIDRLLVAFPHRWAGCDQEFRINNIEFHPEGSSLAGVPLRPDIPDDWARTTSHRQVDGVLWQAGDPWLYPSVLIELDIDRTASVRNHLLTAFHVANQTGRPVTLLYVVGYKARAHVQRIIHHELHIKNLHRHALVPGAKVRIRLVGLRAATTTNALDCPHILDINLTSSSWT